jgi:hypothetical protein
MAAAFCDIDAAFCVGGGQGRSIPRHGTPCRKIFAMSRDMAAAVYDVTKTACLWMHACGDRVAIVGGSAKARGIMR